MRVHQIPLERLSPDAFSPFGQVLAAGDRSPDFSRPLLDNWRFPFASDAPPRLQIMRYHTQQMRLTLFERHVFVTEARFPIDGAKGVIVVAGNTVEDDHPDPKAARAFLIDGSAGLMLKPGVWHGLDCFPVDRPHSDFLFLSDEKTEVEIETVGHGERTQLFDFAPVVEFVVTDPDGLMVR
ncbi:MAG: ureidoglycolate lyase [Pseudomonadota bacterium]